MAAPSITRTGKDVRLRCRSGTFTGPTSGLADGYLQANLIVMPSQLADDFNQFCQVNYGPLPLLYKSKPGETAAPPLATDSDVRTDVPGYQKLVNGVVEETTTTTLIDYPWEDMVTFYLGCSFSFEENLAKSGIVLRNIQENKNVPMFNSNISCQPVGRFSCKMVCSMRPIKVDDLGSVIRITGKTPSAHGSPVHIGDPCRIGIENVLCCDYGDNTLIRDNEVPVFWACGVTVFPALKSAAPELGFTHKPGHMFVSDVPVSSWNKDLHVPDVTVVQVLPGFYSYASNQTVQRIEQLERNALDLLDGCQHQLLRVLLILSHASKVAITVSTSDPGTVLQSLSLASTLSAFGTLVHFIANTDGCAILNECIDYLKVTVPRFSAKVLLHLPDQKLDRCNTCVDFTQYTLPIPQCSDAVVGVRCHYKSVGHPQCDNGKTVDIVTKSRNTGGGYVLAGALHTVMQCPLHWRYRQHAIGDKRASVSINECLLGNAEHLKHLVSQFTGPGGGVDSVAAVTEALKAIDSIKQICVEN